MTWAARLLLVITSLAPIFVVYAALVFAVGNAWLAGTLCVVSALLVVICVLLIAGTEKGTAPANRSVQAPAERDGDALAFLVAYALPLATAKPGEAPSPLGLAAFTLVMMALVWQQQIFHVNPLLGVLGYHFFSAQTDDGSKILVLTRRKTLAPGDLPIVKLSEYLWLHCPKSGH